MTKGCQVPARFDSCVGDRAVRGIDREPVTLLEDLAGKIAEGRVVAPLLTMQDIVSPIHRVSGLVGQAREPVLVGRGRRAPIREAEILGAPPPARVPHDGNADTSPCAGNRCRSTSSNGARCDGSGTRAAITSSWIERACCSATLPCCTCAGRPSSSNWPR